MRLEQVCLEKWFGRKAWNPIGYAGVYGDADVAAVKALIPVPPFTNMV